MAIPWSQMPSLRKATNGKLTAPFTNSEVWSLNAYQDGEKFHPYTCPTCGMLRRDEDPRLVATALGWVCRNLKTEGCEYTQDWAHDWTANWYWKEN